MGSINNAINSEQITFYGFSAYLIATLPNVIGSGNSQLLFFDQTLVNPQQNYSPITGTYTCPLEGLYYVGCSLTFQVNSPLGFLTSNTIVTVQINAVTPGEDTDNTLAVFPVPSPMNLYNPSTVNLKGGNQFYYKAGTQVNFYAYGAGQPTNNVSIINSITGQDIASRYFIYYIGLVA